MKRRKHERLLQEALSGVNTGALNKEIGLRYMAERDAELAEARANELLARNDLLAKQVCLLQKEDHGALIVELTTLLCAARSLMPENFTPGIGELMVRIDALLEDEERTS